MASADWGVCSERSHGLRRDGLAVPGCGDPIGCGDPTGIGSAGCAGPWCFGDPTRADPMGCRARVCSSGSLGQRRRPPRSPTLDSHPRAPEVRARTPSARRLVLAAHALHPCGPRRDVRLPRRRRRADAPERQGERPRAHVRAVVVVHHGHVAVAEDRKVGGRAAGPRAGRVARRMHSSPMIASLCSPINREGPHHHLPQRCRHFTREHH